MFWDLCFPEIWKTRTFRKHCMLGRFWWILGSARPLHPCCASLLWALTVSQNLRNLKNLRNFREIQKFQMFSKFTKFALWDQWEYEKLLQGLRIFGNFGNVGNFVNFGNIIRLPSKFQSSRFRDHWNFKNFVNSVRFQKNSQSSKRSKSLEGPHFRYQWTLEKLRTYGASEPRETFGTLGNLLKSP